MKKIVCLILVAMLIIGTAACGQPAAAPSAAPADGPSAAPSAQPAGEPIKVRVASQFGDEHPQTVALNEFKKLLEERSGGAFTVELYPNNQLGAAEVWQDMLLEGSIEMAFPGGNIANYYGLTSVTECPFLFTTWEEADYIFNDTEICDEMNAAMPEEVGVRSLGSIPIGFRVTTSNKEITGVEGYKDLRLRTPNVNYCVWLAEALGASVISMNFSELFTALEQGTVDAQENPYSTIVANSLYEVQDFVFDSKHMFTAHFWYVNEAWWQSLTAEQQTMVQECVDAACDLGWQGAIDSENDCIATLEEKGVTITYPTDEQRQEMRGVAEEKVWPQFFEAYPGSEEYVLQIQEALASR